MRMEQYLQCSDYTLWEIIENGNVPIVTKLVCGKETVIPHYKCEEKAQKGLIEGKMHFAIESKFRGNTATKRTQKNLLKQQYENFVASITESDQAEEGLTKFALMAYSSTSSSSSTNSKKENGAPIIKDWVYDSGEENVPKVKTVEMFNKPSFAKINFVKSTEQVKSPRKTSVDKNRQNTPSPRGNKRNWNQQMSQKLGSNFEMFNKACHVCGSFDHLKNDCNNWYNNGRFAKPVWTNVQRVNKQNFSKLTHPSPKRNMVPRTVLTRSGPISLNTARQVNIVKRTKVNVSRPKAILSAVNGNKGNAVKASACWVWRPKHKVLDHGNPHQDLKNKGVIDSGCSWHMTGNRFYLTDYEEIDGGFVDFGGNSKGGKITKKGIENLIDLKVKVIKCDNGTEFKNKVMNLFCEMKSIKREFSVAKTPQQNGVEKRKNRTLIEAARTMLADSKLITTFWAEAVNTACFVQNRVCPVTILNTIDHLGKFDGKADEGENTPNIEGSGPNWHFDIDALTKSMNYKPVAAGNQSNGNAGTKACNDAGKARMETIPGKDYILLPMWHADPLFSQDSKSSPDVGFKPSEEEEKKDAEDLGNKDSEVPSKEDPRVNQKKDDNVSSTNNVNTASVNSTNTINTVSPTVNAAGIEVNAVDPKSSIELPYDPNMPELEDIVYSDDDEHVDAEADMNNLDAFMPVNPIPTTRIHKDHPVEQIIGDLHSAPQTRRMTKNLEKTCYHGEQYYYPKLMNHIRDIKEILGDITQRDIKETLRDITQRDIKEILGDITQRDIKEILGDITQRDIKKILGDITQRDIKEILGDITQRDISMYLGNNISG
ncbi:ribonuclease H-like domain-containing protein [Tanacetum coccineum]